MNSKILNCIKAEEIPKEELDQSALSKYAAKSANNQDMSNCWFDTEDKIFFGPFEDYTNTKPYDSLYLMQKSEFLENHRHGIPYFVKNSESGYESSNLAINEEIIYEHTNFSKSVEGKSVFIIGAGPSTSLVNIENICQQYDQIWVCNDYRKHDKVKNITPDLFYLSNEIYLLPETLDFLYENKEITCTMDINVNRNPVMMNKIKKINKDNNFIFSLRSFTSSGVMPRLITLATLLRASKVGFVGLDGYSKEHYEKGVYESSFEGGTKQIANPNFNYRSQCREFILFWDYVVNIINKGTSFINYGNNYEHNVSRHILDFIGRKI